MSKILHKKTSAVLRLRFFTFMTCGAAYALVTVT